VTSYSRTFWNFFDILEGTLENIILTSNSTIHVFISSFVECDVHRKAVHCPLVWVVVPLGARRLLAYVRAQDTSVPVTR
jgi:hypothetical protein